MILSLHKSYFVLIFLFLSDENTVELGQIRSLLREKRVVNGSYSHSENWTWLVSIKNYPLRRYLEQTKSTYMNWSMVGNDSHICGASLISKEWVISAKHCLEYDGKVFKDNWKAGLGSFNLKDGVTNQQIIDIDEVRFYENSTEFDDIVLMHLSKPVQFTERVKPVCLAEEKLKVPNLECIGIGWGSTVSITENALSPKPKFFKAKYVDVLDENCLNDLKYSRTICFSPITGVGCRGDSGGPMVCRNNEREKWKLIGVTSSGTGCTKMTDKIIYTNVSFYNSFIKMYIGDQDFCGKSSKGLEFSLIIFAFIIGIKFFEYFGL